MAIGKVFSNLRGIGRTFLITCLIAFCLGIIGDFHTKGPNIACLIGALLFSWFLREKVPEVLIFISSVFITISLIFPSKHIPSAQIEYDPVSVKEYLPPVIHLILDGHIGIEGIPNTIDQDQSIKQNLKEFYNQNGFSTYGNVYSDFFKTRNSIPNLFNFDTKIEENESFRKKIPHTNNYKMIENNYFQEMGKLGYRIKVYQPSYLDYCQKNLRITSCYTYQPPSISFIQNHDTNVGSKIWFILNTYLIKSKYFTKIKTYYQEFNIYIQKEYGLILPYPWNWNGGVPHRLNHH
ncbi:MAG: hypothetical protein ACQ9MH_12640 [Nitrospinales bacterium]